MILFKGLKKLMKCRELPYAIMKVIDCIIKGYIKVAQIRLLNIYTYMLGNIPTVLPYQCKVKPRRGISRLSVEVSADSNWIATMQSCKSAVIDIHEIDYILTLK